jgi:antitoxin component YwqK of YwqJK toxin-antitoxin module
MMRYARAQTAMDDRECIVHNNTPVTGEVVDHADNGTMVLLKAYRDGREHGLQQEWYSDGIPQSKYLVIDDCLRGVAMDWHRNGVLARRQEFDQFGQLRRRECWAEDGTARPDEGSVWPQ